VQIFSSMYAPHEHAQHHRERVPSLAYFGFFTVDDIEDDIRAARDRRIFRK